MGALARLTELQPRLRRVTTAAQAFGLEPRRLLHAGPPLRDPTDPPRVLLSSAALTCVHEGWAVDGEDAAAQIRAGTVTLEPAQPRGCVLPLAFVASAGTPLFEVDDGAGLRLFAPVSTVRGPDTRMGSRDPAVLRRLALRDAQIASAWRAVLAAHGPLALLPLAARGLAEGDDLHSRTAAANAALAVWLRGAGDATLAAEVNATPLFFLTLWMAASALLLRSAEGGDEPTLATRGGGNGERFGIALAGAPQRWTCIDAGAPQGPRLPGANEHAAVSAAIGDSAVIDLLGCGGQAFAGAPEPLQTFAAHLPADHVSFAERLLRVPHPVLGRPVALDARAVVQHRCAPLVALAMISAEGTGGLLGRGVYRPPVELFEKALAELG